MDAYAQLAVAITLLLFVIFRGVVIFFAHKRY